MVKVEKMSQTTFDLFEISITKTSLPHQWTGWDLESYSPCVGLLEMKNDKNNNNDHLNNYATKNYKF